MSIASYNQFQNEVMQSVPQERFKTALATVVSQKQMGGKVSSKTSNPTYPISTSSPFKWRHFLPGQCRQYVGLHAFPFQRVF